MLLEPSDGGVATEASVCEVDDRLWLDLREELQSTCHSADWVDVKARLLQCSDQLIQVVSARSEGACDTCKERNARSALLVSMLVVVLLKALDAVEG